MKTRTGYLIQRGRVYYAAWTIAGKKFMQSTHKTDKKEAKTELARIMQPFLVEDEVRTLENVKARIEGAKTELAVLDEKRNPPLTIRPAWSAYMATTNRPDTGPTTMEKYEGKFNRFADWLAKAHPEVKAMRDVTEDMAEAYAQDLAGTGMAGATFNAHIGLLRLVWRVLQKKARTERNPWAEVGKKRVGGAGRRELTLDELRTVCRKAEGELRTLLALGLYSGLRLGDCATLRWGEVDLVRGIIRRVPLKTARRNPKPVQIPIHASLRAMLSEIKNEARGEYVTPETAALYLRDASALCKRVQSHFDACGVRTQKPGTGFETVTGEDGKPQKKHTGKRAVVEVGFHSLRHSFVSLCRAANVPLVVVEALVSHASPAVTRLYSHTGADAALAAVNGLPSVIGEDAPKALPPADPFKAKVKAIAESMTAKTWEAARAELLALAGEADNAR